MRVMTHVADLQSRLRADLMNAMRGRRTVEIRALRSLIGAIDNAQAVPLGDGHDKYVVRPFGEAGVEVPRLELNVTSIAALLQSEASERQKSAEVLEVLGQVERAQQLREEAAVVSRYLG